MEARAILRYARISPRKVSIVMDLIRNKPLDEALAILQYTPKAACEPVRRRMLCLPRPHPQAHHAARPGPCVPHPQAHQPHDCCAERERVRR